MLATLRTMAGDVFDVVLRGFRLVVAFLPVLLVIYLLGAGLRNGIRWGAVEVSEWSSQVAGFLLPLAPLASLSAFILMLRVVAADLPSARVDSPGVHGKLVLLASTLVPFLAVYAAQGYLKEDLDLFINQAVYDELLGEAGAFYGVTSNGAADRVLFAEGWFLVSIVLLAFALRFALSQFKATERHVALGGVAAYVEALWLMLFAVVFTKYQDQAWQWILDRRSTHWVQGRWSGLIDWLGVVGQPVQAAVTEVGRVLDSSDDLLMIPVAWLTVGAVAHGSKIAVPPRERPERPWRAAVARVPTPARRLGTALTADVSARFKGLADGVRLLALGGLLPMLMFCLVFVLSRQAGIVVDELWRAGVGPLDHDTGLAFSGWRTVLSGAVETVVLVGLLAAAVDRILTRAAEHDPEPETASTVA